MLIRGILFDNDGTLVDTYGLMLSSFIYATKQVLGKEFSDDELMRGVGTTLESQMWAFTDDPQVHQQLVDTYRSHNHEHHDSEVKAFDGVVEGLARLQEEGVALGVVTAKRHELAWRGLEIAGAAPYLEFLVGADDCAINKPDPAPIRVGLEKIGLDASECLYVGDSPFDIQAGSAAGCATVAVLWGVFGEDVLLAEKPTYVVRSFSELVDLVIQNRRCAFPSR